MSSARRFRLDTPRNSNNKRLWKKINGRADGKFGYITVVQMLTYPTIVQQYTAGAQGENLSAASDSNVIIKKRYFSPL